MAGQRSILAKYANINPEEIRGNIYFKNKDDNIHKSEALKR